MPAGPSDDKKRSGLILLGDIPTACIILFLFTGLRHGIIARAAIFKSGSAHNIR